MFAVRERRRSSRDNVVANARVLVRLAAAAAAAAVAALVKDVVIVVVVVINAVVFVADVKASLVSPRNMTDWIRHRNKPHKQQFRTCKHHTATIVRKHTKQYGIAKRMKQKSNFIV